MWRELITRLAGRRRRDFAVMGVDLAGDPWVQSRHRTAKQAVEAADAHPRSRSLHFYPTNLDDPEQDVRAVAEYERPRGTYRVPALLMFASTAMLAVAVRDESLVAAFVAGIMYAAAISTLIGRR